MRIIIYRPYTDIWFKNPLRRILGNQKLPNKYEGLFDYLVENRLAAISTSLVFRKGLLGWHDALKDSLRLIAWIFFNRINIFNVKLIFSHHQIKENDVIFFMHYGNFTHESATLGDHSKSLANLFSDKEALKVVHMTHYAYNPVNGALNLALMNPDVMVAENNLQKNSKFFDHYFGNIHSEFITLPYVPGDRFKRNVNFSNRIQKLAVTGSITYKMKDEAFTSYFGTNELQPMRRKIYKQRDSLSDSIVSFIYDLNDSRESESQGSKVNESIQNQRNYYESDIVSFYNKFTMFAVPEEICDLPGIGFIEGMACGTAYFGIDDAMYRDLGMIPGIHYVAYDGTLDNLLSKVSYYQEHYDELEIIANQGYLFAKNALSSKKVYGEFVSRLRHILNNK